MEVRDRAEITRYFATTCFDFIEHAPVCEIIYSATTGYNSLVGAQMGKVAFLAAARAIPGMLPVYQAFYLTGVFSFMIMGDPNWFNAGMWHWQGWFRRWHRFMHISPVHYLVMHWDHHDVVPLASISGAGFMENFHRSLTPWMSPYSALFGFNAFAYGVSVGDEWSHNMCPTISHSSVIAQKHVHVDHHFRRTVPLGFNYDQEVEEDGFSYDTALWGNLATFLPPSFELPEKESHAGMTAAITAGQFHIPDGPGSAGPRDKIDAVLFATIRYSGDLSKVLEWVEIYALRLCGLDLLMKGLVKLGLVRMLMPELVAPTPAPAAPAPASPAPATPDHRYSAEPLLAHMD